jgi:hypothetical protein
MEAEIEKVNAPWYIGLLSLVLTVFLLSQLRKNSKEIQ